MESVWAYNTELAPLACGSRAEVARRPKGGGRGAGRQGRSWGTVIIVIYELCYYLLLIIKIII